MKTRIVKLAVCFYVLVGLAFTAQIHAGEYYIFQDAQGKLVISNQKPPAGSKIIKQRTLEDSADNRIEEARRRAPDEVAMTNEGQFLNIVLFNDNPGELYFPARCSAVGVLGTRWTRRDTGAVGISPANIRAF